MILKRCKVKKDIEQNQEINLSYKKELDNFLFLITRELDNIKKATDYYKTTNNEKESDEAKYKISVYSEEITSLIGRVNHFLNCVEKDVDYKKNYYNDLYC